MENSINFKGAFLIQKPTQALKDNIFTVIDKGKVKNKGYQIIDNVVSQGDVLYVVRNKFDRGIYNVLMSTKNAKFNFYPELSTKSGFDDEKPTEAKKILRNAAKTIINTKEKLEAYFKQKIKKPIDIVKVQANNLETIEKTTHINTTGSNYRTNIDHQSGICCVYTMIKNNITGVCNKRHTLISITPPDQYGISYARINPVLLEKESKMRRLAIKDGGIIFEYNEPGSKKFIENEEAAKEHYINTIKKYKSDLVALKAE